MFKLVTLLRIGFIFLCLIGFGWVYTQTPRWVADYIHEKYPHLTVQGVVTIDYPHVHLTQVRVDKDWVFGTLDQVTVDTSKNIWIRGGDLTVIQGPPTKDPKGTTGGAKIQEVQLDSVEVHHTKLTALIHDFKVLERAYCFDKAVVSVHDPRVPKQLFEGYPTVSAYDGCLTRDKSVLELKSLEALVKLPETLPKVGGAQNVRLSDLEVNLVEERVKAAQFQLGEDYYIRGGDLSITHTGQTIHVNMTVVETNHTWIAPSSKRFENLHLTVPLDPEKQTRVRWGTGVGLFFNLEEVHVEGDEECSDWVQSLPLPTSPALAEAASNFKGRMKFEVQTQPIPHVALKYGCYYNCGKSPVQELRYPFEYEVYRADGRTIYTRKTGPGTSEWTPLEAIPIPVVNAFLRLEDPSFARHRGILTASLTVALDRNLKAQGFRLGGSTITQQLAKNLWLKRHKTIGRKVEEAFLTIALESCLQKDEILELYLNAVEFGDNLYGIGPATWYYFDHSPEDLTVDEAYFLAYLLRNPRNVTHPKDGGLIKARKYMAVLARNKLITDMFVPLDGYTNLSDWVVVEDL